VRCIFSYQDLPQRLKEKMSAARAAVDVRGAHQMAMPPRDEKSRVQL